MRDHAGAKDKEKGMVPAGQHTPDEMVLPRDTLSKIHSTRSCDRTALFFVIHVSQWGAVSILIVMSMPGSDLRLGQVFSEDWQGTPDCTRRPLLVHCSVSGALWNVGVYLREAIVQSSNSLEEKDLGSFLKLDISSRQ